MSFLPGDLQLTWTFSAIITNSIVFIQIRFAKQVIQSNKYTIYILYYKDKLYTVQRTVFTNYDTV